MRRLRLWAAISAGVVWFSGCAQPPPVSSGPTDTSVAGSHQAAAGTAAITGNRFIAHGNEPFWSIETDDTSLRWKTPELPAGRMLTAERVVHATGTGYTGKDGGKAFTLVIVHEPCSDGMSDQIYEFTATWTYDDQAMHGCARLEQRP